MISINLEETAILNIYGVNYCCIINKISEKEATNLLENANLCKKSISLGNKFLLSRVIDGEENSSSLVKFLHLSRFGQVFLLVRHPIISN